MRLIDENDLFYLRVAADRFVRQNPEDPNVPAVTRALLNTNPGEKPRGLKEVD